MAGAIVGVLLSLAGLMLCACTFAFTGSSTAGMLFAIVMYTGLAMQILALPVCIGTTWGAWDLIRQSKPTDPNRPRLIAALVMEGLFTLLTGAQTLCMIGMILSAFEQQTGFSLPSVRFRR